MEQTNIFFNPGQRVTLRQDIPNKPIMLVLRKETSVFKSDCETPKSSLIGIRCRWFTSEGKLQEAVWNTKDLELAE